MRKTSNFEQNFRRAYGAAGRSVGDLGPVRSAPRVGRSGTTESETQISGSPDRSVGDAETRLNFALPLMCHLVFVGARFFRGEHLFVGRGSVTVKVGARGGIQ